MQVVPIKTSDKETYNKLVTHPLQSYEWGEFREKEGVKVIRRGFMNDDKLVSGFQMTIHKIPRTNFTIGYLPKGEMPTQGFLDALKQIGKEENCIFIQLEPNVTAQEENSKRKMENFGLRLAAHPLFTKFTFVLDISKSEEDLLADMHPKARYNIKVAKKHNVIVTEDNSVKAFEEYWRLTEETTKRQGFYAHTKRYHLLQWQTFAHQKMEDGNREMENQLTSHLFTAQYDGKILTAMLFFVFHDTLYYPYGASSNEHRNVMHSNLTMWEAIRFGKQLGLKKFDMWGALGLQPDPKDSWFGFHEFKRKFGPEHVEFIGSYDLVLNKNVYLMYKLADKLRWLYLRIRK